MIPVLFEKDAKTFATNGLGRLHDCLSCTVEEERNGIYECQFEIPVGARHFDEIQPGRIIGVTHDETKVPQLFDIIGYSKTIDGVVTFRAVHVSYRLTKACVTLSNINSLSAAFTGIASHIEPSDTGFTFSTNKTSSGKLPAADGLPISVRSLLGGVEGSILDTYGGEYEFDNFKVTLWNRRGQDTNFRIRYGTNMTAYEEETDYLDTYNAVVPYWVGNDEQLVSNMVSSGMPLPGGRTEGIPLDLSDQFETKPSELSLVTAALKHLGNNTTQPEQNITVSFVRLSDSAEYEALKGLQQCKLCDTITVEFPRYNMLGRYKIVKTVWNVLTDRYDSIELGTLSTSLSTAIGVQSSGNSYGSGLEAGTKEIATNLILTSYGRYRLLEFHGFAPSSSAFATLDEADRPGNNQNGLARYTHTNSRFFPALLRVGTDGAVSASYFDSNTTTNTAISGGTIIGQLSWVV